ncbi:GIY-YIG nuclease family protein [Corynebacterium lubricantis]|uniref:GIY-YIG nuclease family protein n=1 Tax=Corynebacterium lubricantis TaxID=541095 RepID=UPI001B7F9316|nr:GIY-YIG nuclease family protein [Corynebacterium lubricantis]
MKLFLMDGSPKGRIKCSLGNWVGKVYLVPRTEITRSKDRPELSQTGLYMLFGTDTESGDELLYVGQARERKNGNGVLGRVAEHLSDEKLDYFTHAILIIDSDNSFGPTEISYLENAFYRQAIAAGRVRTVNGNDPSPGNVTEEKQAELDEFIANAKILIGSLGYRVFDEVNDSTVTSHHSSEVAQPGIEPLLYLKAKSASGSGRQTTDGFVVLAGARLRKEFTDSAPDSVKKNRERFTERISPDGQLLSDTLFSSPTAASNFLTGSSTNGKLTWATGEGSTLNDLEQAELETVTTSDL